MTGNAKRYPPDQLIFIPLGGSGEIGMNLNLYGYAGKWIMVDCGMSFAEPYVPGTELIFPDPTFIEGIKDDLLGIVLTHGHEDHIGAVPYLWPEFEAPLYATPFTASLLRLKLKEASLLEDAQIIEVPLSGDFDIGPFHISYVSLAHSIPEGNALVIATPLGRVFHTGDWKLDADPIIGKPSSAETLSRIGEDGILAVVGDSTNIFNRRASGSEGKVRDSLIDIVAGIEGRVLVTTFASNVARLDTLGRVAQAHGRHVSVMGRSLERMISVAKENGYLTDFPALVPPEEVGYLPRHEVMLITTGCQGEPRAALSRIAFGDHGDFELSAGDTVIFSSKIIPGNELPIGRIQNALVARGIDVITEKDAFIHVSGHPGQDELRDMYGWLKPELLIPVHGEIRHMTAHAKFGQSLGIPHGLVPKNGAVIRLAPDGPHMIDEVASGRLVLDGEEIIPDDAAPILDRRRLAYNGFVTATLILGADSEALTEPVLVVKGVPGQGEPDFVGLCQGAIADGLAKARRKYADADAEIAETVRVMLRRAVRQYSGKKPVTEIHIRRLG